MDIKIKNIIKKAIVIAMSVMLIVGLCFTIQELSENNQTYSENGFDMFTFNSIFITSGYDWANIVLGVLSILHLLAGILVTILSIIFFFKEDERVEKVQKLVIVVSCIFAVVYMISGIVFTAINKESYHVTSFKTSSWLLLLIEVLLLAGYIEISRINMGDEDTGNVVSKKSKYIVHYNDLMKLKTLLDSNIITQEEFETEKEKILK